jgi:hypothetical protein
MGAEGVGGFARQDAGGDGAVEIAFVIHG